MKKLAETIVLAQRIREGSWQGDYGGGYKLNHLESAKLAAEQTGIDRKAADIVALLNTYAWNDAQAWSLFVIADIT
jgi:hypothetical protein